MGIRPYVVVQDHDEHEFYGIGGPTSYKGKWFLESDLLEVFMSRPDLDLLRFFGNKRDVWFEASEGIAGFETTIAALDSQNGLKNRDEAEKQHIISTLRSFQLIIVLAEKEGKQFCLAVNA